MRPDRFELPAEGLAAAQVCLAQRTPASDPVQLRVVARRSGAFAAELRHSAQVLLATTETGLWRGPAHPGVRRAAAHAGAQPDGHRRPVRRVRRRADLLRRRPGRDRAAARCGAPAVAAAQRGAGQPVGSRWWLRPDCRPAAAGTDLQGLLRPVGRRPGSLHPGVAPSRRSRPDASSARLARRGSPGRPCRGDGSGHLRAGDRAPDPAQHLGLPGRAQRRAVGAGPGPAVHLPTGRGCLSGCRHRTGRGAVGGGQRPACARRAGKQRQPGLRAGSGDPVRRQRAAFAEGGRRCGPPGTRWWPGRPRGWGGHTLAKHVGKPESYLRHRLATEPKLKAASTFYDRQIAEEAISGVLKAHRGTVNRWLARGGFQLDLIDRYSTSIGRVVERNSVTITEEAGIKVVLRRSPDMPTGFCVYTAMVSK